MDAELVVYGMIFWAFLLGFLFYLYFIVLLLFQISFRMQKINQLMNLKMNSKNLKSISVLCHKIETLISHFNNLFGFVIALFICWHLIETVFMLFEIYTAILVGNQQQIGFTFCGLFFNFNYGVIVVVIVGLCSKINLEHRKSFEILQTNLRRRENRKMFKILVLQLKHSSGKISCGLCEFTWRLLCNVSIPQ